jgi:hypothetical protein
MARFSDYAENNAAALVLKMIEIWTGKKGKVSI